jgi:hypothetical protein
LRPYSSGHSEDLWDVTPEFLKHLGKGRIWLLPAREPINLGQSFDVVANVLPPEQREEKLAAIVQEQVDRIRQRHPNVQSILVDCGAERNPIYAAAFSKADAGYILISPNPEYFGEVKAVRDELLHMFASINLNRVYVLANQVTCVADVQRCRVGIAPVPLLGAIYSDPVLQRAKNEGLPTHLDLGHQEVARDVREALVHAVGNRPGMLISGEDVGCVPIRSLFLDGGGLGELSERLRSRSMLLARVALTAFFLMVASAGGLVYAARFASGEGLQLSDRFHIQLTDTLFFSIFLMLVLLGAALKAHFLYRSRLGLLLELDKITSDTSLDPLSSIQQGMGSLKARDLSLLNDIRKWIEGRQHDERRKR